jgi:hypothetical protein
MKPEPKDIVFERYGIQLRFAAWYMAYDKGASAGIQVKVNTSAGDARKVDPDDIFGNKTTATIAIQELMAGLSYKDLMDISEWAKTAAKFVKREEVKYRGTDNFVKEHMVNNLKMKETK